MNPSPDYSVCFVWPQSYDQPSPECSIRSLYILWNDAASLNLLNVLPLCPWLTYSISVYIVGYLSGTMAQHRPYCITQLHIRIASPHLFRSYAPQSCRTLHVWLQVTVPVAVRDARPAFTYTTNMWHTVAPPMGWALFPTGYHWMASNF